MLALTRWLERLYFEFGRIWHHNLRRRGMATRRISYDSYIRLQIGKTADSKRRKTWVGEEWDEKVSAFQAHFRSLSFLIQGVSALCVGARTGQEVSALKSLGCDAIGVDLVPSPPLVMYGDMHELPFGESSFDFCFSNCFDHSLLPLKFAAELERVTRSGGHICLHLQLNKSDDFFGVTDVFDSKSVIELFSECELIHQTRINLLSMNLELLLRKI